MIDGNIITIVVLGIKGGKVRLGIKAPPKIPVHRREVFDKIVTGGAGVTSTGSGGGMLVLSRKKNESIVIRDDITIVVVEIRGDKVRLGVEAPKDVSVHRHQIFEAICVNEVAGATKVSDKIARAALKTSDWDVAKAIESLQK